MELMIVVAIIGLIASVAIPKYADLREKANLVASLGNLASIRSAVSIYYGNYMVFPGNIDPKVELNMDKTIQGALPFVRAKYPAANPPYGNGVTLGTAAGAVPSSMGSGWFYCNIDGTVFINSIATDVKGSPYTMY